MANFTYLSRHALKRIHQRTKLDTKDVALLLDRALFVDVGSAPGSNNHHLLFYSELDQACFVAIRDQHYGTVVTVLPLEYHERLAWKVTDKQCQQAQRLIEDFMPEDLKSRGNETPTTFLVSGAYNDEMGQPKVKLLFKAPSAPYGHDLQKFIEDDSIPGRIDQSVNSLNLDAKSVHALIFRLGKHGDPLLIGLR